MGTASQDFWLLVTPLTKEKRTLFSARIRCSSWSTSISIMIMIKNIITKVIIAQVIAGWEEGFTGQCAGEKITMIVPPSLGYGDQASDKVQDIATMADFGKYLVCQVPANSTLYFLTTLDGIVRVTKVTNLDKSLSILSHHHLGKVMSHREYSELC